MEAAEIIEHMQRWGRVGGVVFDGGRPVKTHCGTGLALYVTMDGYVGVQLTGETRVDEYPTSVVEAL